MGGFCTALHEVAGAADCPASFFEQSSNPLLVSQCPWSLSVVFISAAGQQQQNGWGCMAVSAMRWTVGLPCDWARTGCSGLDCPEPMQPSLRAAPHVLLLGYGAGLSGPWAATPVGMFPSVRRVLYITPSFLQAVPYSVLRWLSMPPARAFICPACYQPACLWGPLGMRALAFPGRGCAGRARCCAAPLLTVGCLEVLEAAGCMSLSMGCLSK